MGGQKTQVIDSLGVNIDFATETTLQEVKDNQTNKTQFTKLTDGTNDVEATAANELKVYDDQSKTVLDAIEVSLQNIDANTLLIQQNQIDGDQITLLQANGNTVSDANPLPVNAVIDQNSASTATISTTVVNNTATLVKNTNTSRKQFSIFNDSGAIVYFGYTNTITTSSFSFRLANNDYYTPPINYTGPIYAIRASGSGNVHFTEYT